MAFVQGAHVGEQGVALGHVADSALLGGQIDAFAGVDVVFEHVGADTWAGSLLSMKLPI